MVWFGSPVMWLWVVGLGLGELLALVASFVLMVYGVFWLSGKKLAQDSEQTFFENDQADGF
jgi:hypothetical protein